MRNEEFGRKSDFSRYPYVKLVIGGSSMALFLVQHGISAPKDIDPEKGLSDLGREETNRIAQVAKGYKIDRKSVVWERV